MLQSDIDAGSFTNTVTANAKAVRGNDPAEVEAKSTVTAEDAAAALSITKKADPVKDVAVGDVIAYKVVVKNAGNVSVKDGRLTDDHADLSDKTFALAPGEEAEFNYTYTATQADIDAREVVNIVKANATAVRGDAPAEVTASAIVKAEDKNASLKVVKTTTSEPENGKSYALGETISYKITVTNNGNVTISNVRVTDELTGEAWTVEDSLAPGDSREFTTSYTVTEADILKGEVVNVAAAEGKDPQGEDPKVEPGVDTEPTDEPDTVLEITKSADPASDVAVGDKIEYTVAVRNTGNVTVSEGRLEDDHADLSGETFELAPGAEEDRKSVV